MLKRRNFEVLKQCVLASKPFDSQRAIANASGLSLGTVNTAINELLFEGYIDESYGVTEAGYQAIEPYRIKNAIILAAGSSTRFLPLSIEKPKGLLVVKGMPLIERQILQLREIGVEDITIVVGYMREKFFYLREKYGVDFIENPEYRQKNNTSSLMLVLDKLHNTYVCASDHYFAENIFEKYSYTSNYTTKMVKGLTTEFGYTANERGKFIEFRMYSEDEYGLVGPCCFLEKDAAIFKKHLVKEYRKESTTQMLWEEVLGGCLKKINMYPRPYGEGVIYEFDSLDEVREFDESFDDNIDSAIIADICEQLECAPSVLSKFEPMKIGLTNVSFKFEVHGCPYIYRYPGEQTELFLSREAEAQAEKLAAELGLDESIVSVNPKTGCKLSKCIENYDYIDPYDIEGDQKVALEMIHKLHDLKATCEWEMDFIPNSEFYIRHLEKNHYDFSAFSDMHNEMKALDAAVKAEGHERVLCHNDVWFWNFLKEDTGKIHLIDWEYAGMNWPAADIADYTVSLDFSDEQYLALASAYEGHELSDAEVRFYYAVLALCLWYWYVWAIYTEWHGTVVDDMSMWYHKACHYLALSKELYNLS